MFKMMVVIMLTLCIGPVFAADTYEFESVRYSPVLSEFLAQFSTGGFHLSSFHVDGAGQGYKESSPYKIADGSVGNNPVIDSIRVYSRDESSVRQVRLHFKNMLPVPTCTYADRKGCYAKTIDHSEVIAKLTHQYGKPFATGGWCEEALRHDLTEWRTGTCRIIYSDLGPGACDSDNGVRYPDEIYMESLPRSDDTLTYMEGIQSLPTTEQNGRRSKKLGSEGNDILKHHGIMSYWGVNAETRAVRETCAR